MFECTPPFYCFSPCTPPAELGDGFVCSANAELQNRPHRSGETYQLRCGVQDLLTPPVVYGFWEGYDTDSMVFNRNVIPLYKMAGQEYSLLYPIDGTEDSGTRFEASEPMTMYRALEIGEKPLEPGTYYLEYLVEDSFMRYLPVGRAEVQWDGEKVTVPDGSWEGTLRLTLGDR